MKQTKLWLTTIATLLCSITASAHDFEVDGIYYDITSSTNLTVAVTYRGHFYNDYSNEYSGAVTIPTTVIYNGYTYSVTSIGEYAFKGCSSLTSITIPEGVTSIGEYVFYNCSRLTSIIIPEGVTSIGDGAFLYCRSLTSITIPEGVTSIGNSAFDGCSRLTSITIPEGVTSIGNSAFDGCSRLTSITIPEGVTSIGEYVFYNCSSLTSIIIPEGVTSIGEYAFYGCRSLTSITIPEGVTSIGEYAFYACSSLTFITIPEGVTSIGNSAFYGCSRLTSITIPESVMSIGSDAFNGTAWYNNQPDGVVYAGKVLYEYRGTMPANTSIEIKEGTVGIQEFAFRDCGSLISITIPESVTSIGEYAFYGCSSLTFITIPEGVTSIGNSAFYDCSSLTSITIPESVTSIGRSAFNSCSRLTSIILPESVTSIGNYAFDGCSSLTAVHISGIEAWCNLDFENSSSNPLHYAKNLYLNGELVKDLSVPETVTAIKKNAFYACRSLASITIPEGVTSIGEEAFSGCNNLASITIPASVTSIGNSAFDNCMALKEVTFKDGSKTLSLGYNSAASSNDYSGGEGLFYDCPLTSIYLGRDLSYRDYSSNGYSPFANNKSLRKVTVGECVTFIPSYAFYNCDLNSIVIPENSKLTSIEGYAFFCCNITSIIIPEDLTFIGDAAFVSCPLKSITCYAVAPPKCYSMTRDPFSSVNKAIPVYVPQGAMSKYELADSWKEFAYIKEWYRTYNLVYVVDTKVYKTYSVKSGDSITLPEEPSKEGYTLSGWGEVPETMPAEDVTISGTFIVNKYLVTFKIGDEVIAADSLEYGATIVVPEAPEKEGYTFNGWGDVAETVPANDLTYVGSYSVNSYLLTYTVDGETIQSDAIAYGTAITLLDEPTKEGCTFSGWSEAPEAMPANDVVISGTFIVNTYKVYYYVGEELVHTAEVAYGAAIPEYIYEPTGEGDVFEGWVGETYETMPAHDVTYTANITNGIGSSVLDAQGSPLIYDLMGRKVLDTENLKGIYIINGKKVVIE